jgi:hypothetical protein
VICRVGWWLLNCCSSVLNILLLLGFLSPPFRNRSWLCFSFRTTFSLLLWTSHLSKTRLPERDPPNYCNDPEKPQENQKIVLKKNSDSKTNFSSIKLCIQIKLGHKRNLKKKTPPTYNTRKENSTKTKKQKSQNTTRGIFLQNNHKINNNNNNTTLAQKPKRKQVTDKKFYTRTQPTCWFSANQPRKEGVEAKTWCWKMKQKSTKQRMLRVKARAEEELG